MVRNRNKNLIFSFKGKSLEEIKAKKEVKAAKENLKSTKTSL